MRTWCAIVLCSAVLAAQDAAPVWKPLFDGKTLQGWRETPFPRRGEVSLSGSSVILGNGRPFTGITWTGEFPRTGYEIRLEARRVKGGDFFASLTFPVGDSHCTWVTGGWG